MRVYDLIGSLLQQLLGRYIHNIELEGLGLLGGDVVLENLEIRKDVLRDSLGISTDYDFSRGFIKELRIHIPWTRLQSRPIEIKFNTVEIIISPTTHESSTHGSREEHQASSTGATTGWMQQLLTKVLANMSISVSNLVLKYKDADVVASAFLKSLTCFSADPDREWTPTFASLDDPFGLLHKLVRASHLTVCLERYCDPDTSRGRQAQAFEVPILDRGSFDVRVMACVWLVAPGPQESQPGASSEDQQQAQAYWREFVDEDAVEMSGSSWGVGRRGGGTMASAQTNSGGTMGFLGRLVGVDLRSRTASDEADAREIAWLPVPCACPMLRDGWSRRASASYSPFYDGHGVWSRGETNPRRDARAVGGTRSGTPGSAVQGEGGETVGGKNEGGCAGEAGSADSDGVDERVDGDGADRRERLMPSPTVVADVLIEDLSFSLSNLQVGMMKDLIDRAVHHVARNASRKSTAFRPDPPESSSLPPAPPPPPAPVTGAVEAPAARGSWWPSFLTRNYLKAEEGKEEKQERSESSEVTGVASTDGSDEGDAIFFAVVSASVGSVSLSLLEHQPQRGESGEAEEDKREATTAEEPESISVPVHGLGTVSIRSVPVTLRPLLRPPVAFVVATVTGVHVDAHVLPDGKELAADVKLQVSSVAVRHVRGLGDRGAPASPERLPRSDEVAGGEPRSKLEDAEYEPQTVVSWGDVSKSGIDVAAAANGGDQEEGKGGVDDAGSDVLIDPRSAADVRRCLLERLRGLPLVSADEIVEPGASPRDGDGVDGVTARASPNSRSFVRSSQKQSSLKSSSPLPPPPPQPSQPWAPAPYPRMLTAGNKFAVQYRLLKVKDVSDRRGGEAAAPRVVADRTSSCHDLRVGSLRAHLTQALLEQLLIFACVGKAGESRANTSQGKSSSFACVKEGKGTGRTSAVSRGGAHRHGSFSPVRGEVPRMRRASWSPLRGASIRAMLSNPRGSLVVPPPSLPIATVDTSVNVVLLSSKVALDLTTADRDLQEESAIDVPAMAHGRPASDCGILFLVFSIDQVGISCSESVSHFAGSADKQQEVRTSAALGTRLDESDSRVCTLSLRALSVVVIDEESAADARGGFPTQRAAWPLPEKVFAAASSIAELPATQVLLQTGPCRVTAEIVREETSEATRRGGSPSRMETSANHAARGPSSPSSYSIVFNASCESMCACAGPGVTLLVLEAFALARKISLEGRLSDADGRKSVGRTGESNTSCDRWRRAWASGVAFMIEGVSVGGVVKRGGHQFTGILRRLRVSHVGKKMRHGQRFSDISHDAAMFEARDDGSEAMSFSIDSFDNRGNTGVFVSSDFKFAVLHYTRIKRALHLVDSAVRDWKIGAASPRVLGDGQAAAGTNTSHASVAQAGGKTGVVHFDFRGAAVSLQLPFELSLKVEGVRASSRRMPQIVRGRPPQHQQSIIRGRPPQHQLSSRNGGRDMTIDLLAGDVMVLHAAHGARSSPQDDQQPAIRCAALGVVRLRPSANAASVALESDDVKVCLTPAFCASFGSFIRFMVGPPPVPPSPNAGNSPATMSPTAGVVDFSTPASFSFELKIGQVIADFVTGPCNPWAISANLIVDGVLMRQSSTAAPPSSPASGSSASFEISVEKLEGTQRRDPARNAPALPQEAVGLIREFISRTPALDVFIEWLAARKNRRLSDSANVQPFVVALHGSSGSSNGNGRAATDGRAFSVVTTTRGPRQRLMNGLTLRLAPTLLAFYPPIARLLVGHYNRFGGQAFRSFRARSQLPRRKIGVMTYDMDIRGSGVVFLASLAVGARGLHVFAGQVTVRQNEPADRVAPEPPSLPEDPRNQALSMTGFVGPVGVTFVRDWRCLLPKSMVSDAPPSGALGGRDGLAQLCVPVDLRWTVSYNHMDRFRQDIYLSSVQLYLEQSHFDLCSRLSQIFVAADFPGALAPTSRSLSSDDSTIADTSSGRVAHAVASTNSNNALLPVEPAGHPTGVPAAGNLATSTDVQGPEPDDDSGIDSFMNLSLRLPLLQLVLAMGKRDGPSPPVLEIDVASIRLAQGGVLTVRHVSVNSWPQQLQSGGESMRPTAVQHRSGGAGVRRRHRVLERSGKSEESGKDFARMEVRVPTATTRTGRRASQQAKVDIVFQVEPFNVHVNPDILYVLSAYATPVPYEPGSPEAREASFPNSVRAAVAAAPTTTTSWHTNDSPAAPSPSLNLAAEDSSEHNGLRPRSLSGVREPSTFERSAKQAAASMKLIAPQVSIVLSSYPGGPAFIATTSHVFLRGITRAPGGSSGGGGDEVFAKVSRLSCSVDCWRDEPVSPLPNKSTTWAGGPRRLDVQRGDVVLKPFDVDIHLTRPQPNGASGSGGSSGNGARKPTSSTLGWHAGIHVDDLYLRVGATHTFSLERLARLFIPALVAVESTADKLTRGPSGPRTASVARGRGAAHANDLLVLERVEAPDYVRGEKIVKPRPGQAVFYGLGTRQLDAQEEATSGPSAKGADGGEDGWVVCCEWKYSGLRRISQLSLPCASVAEGLPLVSRLVVDELEMELSFVDPLTGDFKAATRFNVPCQQSNATTSRSSTRGQRTTVEPSQPLHARTWRLAWRIPKWVKPPGSAVPLTPSPSAVSAWSSAVLRSLSVQSIPGGPVVGPSYASATIGIRRVTLALLTDGSPSAASPNGLGGSLQAEEIVRVIVDDINTFAETGPSSTDDGRAVLDPAVAVRGSAEVAVEVQDFSNFLRLPLVSHALVTWNVAMCGGGGGGGRGVHGGAGVEEVLLSTFRPVTSAAVEMQDAVISVSATAMQCVDRCLGELSLKPPIGDDGLSSTVSASANHESKGDGSLPSAVSSLPPLQRQRRKGYIVTNSTDRSLWFGQVSTTETVVLSPGVSTSYRWRTIPAPVAATAGGNETAEASRLELMLRLALHRDGRRGGGAGAMTGSFGAWTEPFPADRPGTYMRLLRNAGAEGSQAAAEHAGTGGDAMAVPLWVMVSKEGLQTRIELRGEWVFTNHLPQEVQVTWATVEGGGRSNDRTLVEPPGTRGDLILAACSIDQASALEATGSDPVQDECVPRPESLSALTSCAPVAIPGASEEWRGRLSELRLEFRLAGTDGSAVVGSVGPPPITAISAALCRLPVAQAGGDGRDGNRAGGGEGRGGDTPGGGEEDGVEMSWAATRQSDWVEARPGIYLSLISCASPNLMSSGIWFWCVASRQATPLRDCADCVSAVGEHRCHLGQMTIDLRPMAMLRNRCSLPLRVMMESAEREYGDASRAQVEHPQPLITGKIEDDTRATHSVSSLYSFCRVGLGLTLAPGRRTAVCQQPFVDYRLTFAGTRAQVGAAAPPDSGGKDSSRPFVISVPSELFYRSCEARWLPLHERALRENVLSPLVVVASRPFDSHWPSLTLHVYPGLSIKNNLPMPLSVFSAFHHPVDTETEVPGAGSTTEGLCDAQHDRRPSNGRVTTAATAEGQDDDPDIPLLRRSAADREKRPSSADGRRGSRDGRRSDSCVSETPSSKRFCRIFHAPAESLHSAWDIHDISGDPVPCVLPAVHFEFSLCTADAKSAASPAVNEPKTAATHDPSGQRQRSPRVVVNLDSDVDSLNKLVLVPWTQAPPGSNDGGDDGSGQPQALSLDENVVLPVIVTLGKETVAGGVDLLRLEIHPRVVVHNATNLPVSLSLVGAHSDSCPLWRTQLSADGHGSSMAVPALPGKRGYYPRKADVMDNPSSSRRDTDDAFGAARDVGADDASARNAARSGGRLRFGLSWLMKSAYKAAPAKPTGFWADLGVAFGREDTDDEAAGSGDKRSIVSLAELESGAPLHCEPPSITVAADEGRRAARVCVAVGIDPRDHDSSKMPSSAPSRHVVLFQDPQPVLTVCNRAAGPVTIMFDCGATVEVCPGKTAEHSWSELTSGRDRKSSGGVGGGGIAAATASAAGFAAQPSPRRPPASPLLQGRGRIFSETHSHHESESSFLVSPTSSTPPSPCSSNQRRGSGGRRPSAGGGSAATSSSAGGSGKKRTAGKIFGGSGNPASLQHWFRCKGASEDDESVSWSNPLWVARGVQVIRFDRRGGGGGWHFRESYGGGSGGGGGADSVRREVPDWDGFGSTVDNGLFGAGPDAREVQVHVMERAGGFIMSFAEGGFEGIESCVAAVATAAAAAADGGASEGAKSRAIAETRSSSSSSDGNLDVLSRWAKTQEQHLVLKVSGTTIQLLDDSELQAVGGRQDPPSAGSVSTNRVATVAAAARAANPGGTVVNRSPMGDWIGGHSPSTDGWEREGPVGLLSDATSAALPAAAIPAILSVVVDGASVRLWRAAPSVQPGMSTLDLERFWHLKDRVGLDVSLEMLQVDNHVAGHILPVMFCFRQGGSLVRGNDTGGGDGASSNGNTGSDCRFFLSLVVAECWKEGRVPSYLEQIFVRSAPMDVFFEDSVLPPLVKFMERAGLGRGLVMEEGSSALHPSATAAAPAAGEAGVQLPPKLASGMVPRLFIQRVDIGALVVRATVQGYIPGKKVFLALDKSPLLFRPVSLRGVLARPEEIAEQIASNYAADALLRSLAVVGSLQALGSPTTLLSEWGKGVYDLFAMPIRAVPQGPSSTIRATFRGVSSLLRHASAGTLSSVSGVTNALSRNIRGRGGVVGRPIAGTMGLVHRTSRSLIASTGVNSEWKHAAAAAAANPAVCRLNADLWYRWCLLPPGHEFLYRTPALCSNASYSQANVPVTIVLSSNAVFLYRGSSGCEILWKEIEHQHITLVEQSAEHSPAELILNARAFRRPRHSAAPATGPPPPLSGHAAGVPDDGGENGAAAAIVVEAAAYEQEEVEVGEFLIKLSLPSGGCSRELAQLLQGLSGNS